MRSRPREGSARVAGGPDFFTLAREFHFAIFERAGEAQDALVDLVAGLLPDRHLERDLVPVDGAFAYGRADVVEL